jgi:predicted GNAT family N-acyltransferase
MTVEVRRARDEQERAAALRLVEAVFGGEQGIWPRADGREPDVLRLVAAEDDGTVLGTCRLLLDAGVARLGSLVVARERRGEGLGRALLGEAEREARTAGADLMRLNAQLSARGLYDHAGYRAVGDVFIAEGIDHVAMEKELAGA